MAAQGCPQGCCCIIINHGLESQTNLENYSEKRPQTANIQDLHFLQMATNTISDILDLLLVMYIRATFCKIQTVYHRG